MGGVETPFQCAILSFHNIASACEHRGIKVASNGTRFVCLVPAMGHLGYLHTLFAGCTDDKLKEIAEAFGFPLPESYVSFLRLHNGASLFCATIEIFGLGGNYARSLRDEDQAPISLTNECALFSRTSQIEWREGWRPVGSAAAENLHKLMIDATGAAKIVSASGRERRYPSFPEMLNAVLLAWSGHFNCGGFTGGENYESLELTAESLAATEN